MAKPPKPDAAYRQRPAAKGKGANVKRADQATRSRRKPSKKSVAKPQNVTPKRWADYLENLANGMTHSAASHAVGVTMMTIDAHLISNVAAAGQIRDAKLLWTRREWPTEEIENVLAQIALGKTVRQAFDAVGVDHKRIGSLYRLLLTDKALRKWYDEARQLQAESYADDIIDISDARSNDRDENGKILHEVINRDRLRVDSRKWLSGKWAPKRYGDNKHVLHEGDININHAAILSGGRKRIEALHAQRKGATVDHETEQVINE